MRRRTTLVATTAILCLFAAVPARPQSYVPARPGPAAGAHPLVEHPSPLGAPQTPGNAQFEAPRPKTELSIREHRRMKEEARTRRDTGGTEVNIDVTPSPLSPNVGASFTGVVQNGWAPYDAAIAVGPSHVLEMTNSQWTVYDRNGTQLSNSQFSTWWGTQAGTPFDPRCFYDSSADRWIMVAVSKSSALAFYHISVSQTGNPAGAWFNYQLDASLDGTTQTSNWADFPALGYDNNRVFLTSNQYTLSGNVYQHGKLRVFAKSQLYGGGTLTWTDYVKMQNADGSYAASLQPAVSLTSTTTEYFANTSSAAGSYVTLWSMNANGNMTRAATVNVGTYAWPPDAPQPGTTTLVETNDSRISDHVVWRNNTLHLVFAEAYSGRAAMRYVRIDTTNGSKLKDITYSQAGVNYYFPAVAVDSADNVYFVFSRSSSTEYVSLYQTGMTPADNSIQSSALLKAGNSITTSGRWGDYSGAAIDPSNSLAVWVYGGWASTSNKWATWSAQPSFAAPPNPVPTLSSITPAAGNQGQSAPVTLYGTGFLPSFTIAVSGTGVTVSNPACVSITQLTATLVIASNASTGARNVTVTTAGGTTGTQLFSVSAAASLPTLSAITPAVMNPGQTVTATLTGTNFVAPATITFASGTGVTATNVTVVSSTQITASFVLASNASLGGHLFKVGTPGGTSNQIHFDALNKPTLTGVTPNNANPATSVNVTLSGTNFYSGSTIAVSSAHITVSNTVRVNTSTLTATFTVAAGATPGSFNITVNNLAGTSNAVPFTINTLPPTLTSVTPASAAAGASISVTLDGTNFTPTSTIAVSGTGVAVANQSFVSTTRMTATFTLDLNATAGARNVSITNAAATSNSRTFTVNPPPAPALLAISPASAVVGTSVGITLTGANFTNAAALAVSGSGVTVSNTTVVSSAQMTATLSIAPTATSGSRSVTVSTTGGNSNALTLSVILPPPPTLLSVTPPTASIGTSFTATLLGTNFIAGATSVNISGVGVTVSGVTVDSPIQISAAFTVAASATAGLRNVTVVTPGGTSNSQLFTVVWPPPPTLLTVLPSVMNPATSTTVTLTGTNFVDGGTTLTFTTGTGMTATNVNVISPAQLTVTIVTASTASLGGHQIKLTTPSGTSGSLYIDVLNAPVLTSISPASGAKGTAVTVTLSGTGFYNGSTVSISGSGVTVSNVVKLTNGLRATFTIASGAASGPRDVRVANLGGVSNAVPFSVP